MEIYQDIETNQIIEESLNNSISYKEYRKLVEDLVIQKSTSGSEKTKALAEYTKLNNKRMKRWDKTLKILEESKNVLSENYKSMTWLILTESWCGDAAHVIPVINKVAELNENIKLRLVLRDENKDLMDAYLTKGARAIPKLISIDEQTGRVINTFGPRPSEATKLVEEYKIEHGSLTPEFKQDLQVWYNKDKGQSTIEDLLNIIQEKIISL